MNNIIYDEEVITPNNNRYKYYYDFIEKLNARDCVKFALFCAKIVNNNSKESNNCIGLIEKWLVDEKSVKLQELWDAADTSFADASVYSYSTSVSASYYAAADAVNAAYYSASAAVNAAYYSASNMTDTISNVVYASSSAVANAIYCTTDNINIINKYLQILLRKTKQFKNNKILEQISKVDVDKLELVDWNMITDIIQEEYNIIHGFDYEDIFSRRCLIELLRREYV